MESEFLVNTVKPEFISDIKWIEDQPVQPINDFEKSLLKGTMNPTELLEREKREREEQQEETEEQRIKRIRKDYITKVKVVALDLMGKPPLDNPSKFTTREKKKLMEQMEMVMTKSDDEITALFNNVCSEVLFAPESDYTKFTPLF